MSTYTLADALVFDGRVFLENPTNITVSDGVITAVGSAEGLVDTKVYAARATDSCRQVSSSKTPLMVSQPVRSAKFTWTVLENPR